MNKQETIKAIAGKTGLTQVAIGKVLTALEEVTEEVLAKGDKLQLTGFITIKPAYRAPRKGFDPLKKVAIDIPATMGVSAKAGEKTKKAVAALNVADFAPAEVEVVEATETTESAE